MTLTEFKPRFPDTPEGRLMAAGYSKLFPDIWLAPDVPPLAFTTEDALARIGAEDKPRRKKGKK